METLAYAPVTFALLVVNVVVSLFVLLARPDLMGRFSLRPYAVVHERDYERLLTSGFLHVGIGHLLFNMMTLFFFGPYLEELLGPLKFAALYFGSELAANALSVFLHRNRQEYSAVGASGAISGVVFAFCLFEPWAKLYVFFAIPMPAIVFAVVYVAGSIYAMRQSRSAGLTGGIAHEAHLGGAVGGVLLALVLEPRALGIFLSQIGIG